MTALATVPTDFEAARPSAAARLQALTRQARDLALEHVEELEEAMARVARLAAEVADGGSAYPVGIRAICERLSPSLLTQRTSIAVLHAVRPFPVPAIAS